MCISWKTDLVLSSTPHGRHASSLVLDFFLVVEDGKIVAVTPGGGPYDGEKPMVKVLAGDVDMKQENGD